jgi:hypothetical protein
LDVAEPYDGIRQGQELTAQIGILNEVSGGCVCKTAWMGGSKLLEAIQQHGGIIFNDGFGEQAFHGCGSASEDDVRIGASVAVRNDFGAERREGAEFGKTFDFESDFAFEQHDVTATVDAFV